MTSYSYYMETYSSYNVHSIYIVDTYKYCNLFLSCFLAVIRSTCILNQLLYFCGGFIFDYIRTAMYTYLLNADRKVLIVSTSIYIPTECRQNSVNSFNIYFIIVLHQRSIQKFPCYPQASFSANNIQLL